MIVFLLIIGILSAVAYSPQKLFGILARSWNDLDAVDVLMISILVGVFINITRKRAGFTTNSQLNMDYRTKNLLDIDSGKGKYRNYITQGYSMTADYIYFSAYHKYETCDNNSGYDSTQSPRVFKIDRVTEQIVKVYTLDDLKVTSHVGGLGVIEETNQFFIADYSTIKLYSMDDADKSKDKDVKINYTTSYANTFLGAAVSFMNWDSSRNLLWIGHWDADNMEEVGAIRVEFTKQKINKRNTRANTASLLKPTAPVWKGTLPVVKVQGIAVVPNSQDKDAKNPIIYLATSYGSADSLIFKWDPSSNKPASEVASGWRGLEGIDFDPRTGGLWGITEAGSKYYQNRKKECGGSNPWPYHKGYIYAEIAVE